MKDNYCVIMGGGIGSRFWPFSRESYPKQFLDFFGTGRSLLQMTFDRFSKIIPVENIFIVTNEAYADLIKEQLPELKEDQILLEPARRNTAPCIAYAAYHIRACNPNANIVVAPSDHLILKEDIFLKDVQKGLDFVKNNNALVTLGIKPSRPETGYGYIQSSDSMLGEFTKVKTFTEKPNLELAKVFYESGEFFWNSGLFVWNVNTILEAFAKYLPDIAVRFDLGKDKFNTENEREFIHENFPYCLKISIDYGIMEKADSIYTLPGNFGWDDVGSWLAVGRIKKNDDNSNVINGNVVAVNTKGCVIEGGEKLIATVGLRDIVVVDTKDATLITTKENAGEIKQVLAKLREEGKNEYL